ncbi:MAG: SAM-dependent chlorinase/fluorinase [Thermoplasmata archaeon]|nr:SAM-dependent chlorinase/fluorinase [Thermoplasmata archaeon]
MIITLTTDIGWEYAAEMKGVIYSMNPSARIVDITHEISPQNIMQGAFVLYSIAPYFKNAIHVGVVDPGVGTNRKAIAVKCRNAWFIGPDNGLFYPAASRLGIEKIYELEIGKDASNVFHGRDVFAPAAALLSAGLEPDWEEIDEMVIMKFPEAEVKENRIYGKVLFVDKFGNIITNVEMNMEMEKMRIKIGEKEIDVRIYPSYGYAKEDELIGLRSSSGFLEIAVRNGNAASLLGVKGGEEIEIFL